MGKTGDDGWLSTDFGTIFGRFLVGRRLFCRSTQVKSFVDRSADFYGFCHRWSVGRWSPHDRQTIGRLFEDFFTMISAEGRPIIRRQSAIGRSMIFYQRTVCRQTYVFSPLSTSWYRRFGTGFIVRNVEWRIFVIYSVFSALFPLKLRFLFEEGILHRGDTLPW